MYSLFNICKSICCIAGILFLFVAPASASNSLHPLGCEPSPTNILLEHSYPGVRARLQAMVAPTSVDWSGDMPNVGDQGQQGSCTAWATGYNYKSYQEKLEHGWSNQTSNHQFSPSYIYNQINGG